MIKIENEAFTYNEFRQRLKDIWGKKMPNKFILTNCIFTDFPKGTYFYEQGKTYYKLCGKLIGKHHILKNNSIIGSDLKLKNYIEIKI